jgi:site-specific recombinase XerD
MTANLARLEELPPQNECERQWADLAASVPALVATMRRYLTQLHTFLAPRSVDMADQTLRQFTRWLAANDVTTVSGITRRNIEDYKVHLVAQPGINGQSLAKSSQRHRLGTIRSFFERLIEWDWPEAPRRNPIFHGDLPGRTDSLPKFLEAQPIGEGSGTQRFLQSMSFAVSRNATARANCARR